MRLISGQYKGRILKVPEQGTRPTADRAKEMLFDILNARLMREQKQWTRIRFADVFAGSGAVGLEAVSRGAKHVWLFENNRQAQNIIRQNGRDMSFELLGDALIPPVINKPMDILFMDAPYAKGLWEMALPAFDKNGWIDEKTCVIIEIDNQEEIKIPTGFTLIQNRRQGRNTFLFLQKEI